MKSATHANATLATVTRRRRVRLYALVPLFALLIFFGARGVPWSVQGFGTDPGYADTFRDVRPSDDIDVGPDLGGTGHSSLNFTGPTGSAGDTWMLVHTDDSGTVPTILQVQILGLGADVLIHKFNNKKGAGLFALYNEEPGKKGLALILYDNGNTDTLVLATVDQDGRLAKLKSVSLGAAILENAWYRLQMDVTVNGDDVSVSGSVFNRMPPGDPESLLGAQVGTLAFSGARPDGVDAVGEFGVIASAFSTYVDSSVTNFEFLMADE